MAKQNSTRFPFTTKKLETLKARTESYEVGDTGAPGLRLRVYPSGAKVFRWYFCDATRKHRVRTLGAFPGEKSLADARRDLERLKETHQEALQHGDIESSSGSVVTVKDLAEEFYKRRIKNQRKRPEEALAILDNDVIPKLGRRKLSVITAPIIGSAIMAVVDRGAAVHAGKVLNLTKQMFAFGESLGYLNRNPAASLKADNLGIESNVRDRHLSSDEIRKFWKAVDAAPRMSEQTKVALRLLLLTGVRSQELLLAKWEHVDLDQAEWTIPVENQKLTLKQTKKAKPFVIPLPESALTLFKELKNIAGKSPWVMASEAGGGHYTDKALSRAMRRLFDLKIEKEGRRVPLLKIEPASPHDLRRTMRTAMAEHLDIQPHVAEKCLNHSLGRLEGTYNHATLFTQRREALAQWADWIDLIVTDRDNVAVIGGAA